MSAPSSTQTEQTPAVVVEDVVKTFGDVQALCGLSVTIPVGSLVALVGANGSGKSTLLKLLFGILKADAGTVRVLGQVPRHEPARLRVQTGYAGQDTALDPETTGWETLRLFYALRRLPPRHRRARLTQLAKAYGLAPFADRRIAGYSGGQRQRLHLALEVMHAPRLLLLDEPASGLDPEGRRAFWDRLAAWRADATTIVVATHDLPNVAAYGDRVLLLKDGRLLADDAPADLVAAHGRARAVIMLDTPPANPDTVQQALRDVPGVLDAAVVDQTVTLWRDRHPAGGEPALEVLAAHGLSYTGLERHAPDLAGAYFHLTGHPLTSASPDRSRRPAR